MHSHTNRLAGEKSPYLLQHAHNPVDWYPWGEEAFDMAKREDKPIFLSIGYATCHWCHVMEHESFENEAIATLMNNAFVCIKVDREERPDIDTIYMTVCQMMTGQGGWPLTIIMTPDKKPFHAATYIPPEQRFGRIGMTQLVPRIEKAWKSQRVKVLDSSLKITEMLAQQNSTGSCDALSSDLLQAGYTELLEQYDAEKGGFGQHPKFPTPHRLTYLLRHGGKEGIAAVEHTLQEMRKGGIFDHIGYGFHRYSTDRDWLLPHFEKMLYDQALLVLAYTEAFERTKKPLYKQVVEETIEYVLRDMTAPEGGFYSAEDADSEGEEGLFYIWTSEQLKNILGDEYEQVATGWNISELGNFRDEATGIANGQNIPHLSTLPDGTLEDVRKRLFEEREKRTHPLKDTKVLADWNGLMIAALTKAGRVLGEERYVQAAIRANRFIETEMRQKNGALWHRWREGHTAVLGQLEDYAFMIFGLLELYETTFDIQWLEAALRYNTKLTQSFADEKGGGFFMTADDAEELIVRPKEVYDGAIPSGNSVQMLNLLKLARLTGRSEFEQQAIDGGKAFDGKIERSPSNFAQALMALHFATEETVEIVVVGERGVAATEDLLKYIHSVYNPSKVVLFKDVSNADKLSSLAPFTKDQTMVNGQATVYICRNFACEKPIHSLAELKSRFN